jgi:hypothetical protein
MELKKSVQTENQTEEEQEVKANSFSGHMSSQHTHHTLTHSSHTSIPAPRTFAHVAPMPGTFILPTVVLPRSASLSLENLLPRDVIGFLHYRSLQLLVFLC